MNLILCFALIVFAVINVDSWHVPAMVPDRWGWLKGLFLTVMLIVVSMILTLSVFVDGALIVVAGTPDG